MKILILVQHKDQRLEKQAELLKTELEKLSYDVDWSDQSHPLRLLTTSYDLIWTLTDQVQLSLKNILLLTIAKSLGLPTMLSFLGEQNLLTQNTLRHKYVFNLFDSISVTSQSTYNKLKFGSVDKWIWAGIPSISNQKKKNSALDKSKILIIPIFKDFKELDSISNFTDQPIYIDATKLKKIISHVHIRKQWQHYIKFHPQFKSAFLVIEQENRNKILDSHHSFIKLNHIEPNPLDLLDWIEICTHNLITPILSESAAVGFFDFWKTEKNCKISPHFKRKHFEDLSSIEQPHLIENKKLLSASVENKINEISRRIHKLDQNKKAQLSYAHMSYRS